MGLPSLNLEPSWNTIQLGDRVNVQGSLIVHDPEGERHLLRSTIGQRLFLVRGDIPKLPSFSFLGAEVCVTGQRTILDITHGHALGHETPQLEMYSNVIDVCSGIGIMADGLRACGLNICAVNDLREENCNFQTRQGQTNVVVGDIANPSILAGLHSKHPCPALVSAGFSCQPWSRLGDGGRSADPRSGCLGAVLEASFWLKAHSILLECVDGAGADQEVQSLIQQFCQRTQFRQAQINLRLDQLCPAKRDRWWCLLINPTLPGMHLRPLPCLPVQPTLGDVLPVFPEWGKHDMEQLQLDRYELNKFMEFDSLFSNMIDMTKQVKTALHGWANQLMGCPCQCRLHPFSESRLKLRGLFGALIPVGGFITTYLGELPLVRHMHPWEMALIHGVRLDRIWGPKLRLAIAGLGQMASPVQSCWVTAQFMYHVAEGYAPLPEMVLWSHFMSVFQSAQVMHPSLAMHPKFQAYVSALHGTLYAHAQAHLGPDRPIGVKDQEQSSIHRKGRKDPQIEEEHQKDFKQPGSGPQEPKQDPAEEAQKLHQPIAFQAKPTDVQVGLGPSPPGLYPHVNMQKSPDDQVGAMHPGLNQASFCHAAVAMKPAEPSCEPSPSGDLHMQWNARSPTTDHTVQSMKPDLAVTQGRCDQEVKSTSNLLPVHPKDEVTCGVTAEVSGRSVAHFEPVRDTCRPMKQSETGSKQPGFVPIQFHPGERTSPSPSGQVGQESKTSHRQGRKDPLHLEKQPGTGPQEPKQNLAKETQELHPPIAFQAKPLGAFVASGPSPHPCDGAGPCQIEPTMPGPQPAKPADQKGLDDQPVHSSGGLFAFATKKADVLQVGPPTEPMRVAEPSTSVPNQGVPACSSTETKPDDMDEIGDFSQEMLA